MTTIIKHSPNSKIGLKTEADTTFLVKSKTPYISAIKRIDKMLEKFDKASLDHKKYQRGEYKKVKYVVVKGMGRAIEKTTSIGLHYMTQKAYKVDIRTGTVEVLDEIKTALAYSSKDDSDEESLFKKRNASFVEVRVWLKRQL